MHWVVDAKINQSCVDNELEYSAIQQGAKRVGVNTDLFKWAAVGFAQCRVEALLEK